MHSDCKTLMNVRELPSTIYIFILKIFIARNDIVIENVSVCVCTAISGLCLFIIKNRFLCYKLKV